jgi:hypothetical protein
VGLGYAAKGRPDCNRLNSQIGSTKCRELMKCIEQQPQRCKENLMEGTDPYVLVKGPAWGEAQFYGEWLLAAGKAEAYWKEAYADQDFKQQIDRVCVAYIPDFGIAATVMIMQLKEYRTTFLIELNSEDGDDFAMMAEMGFFAQRYPFYQMTLPSSLTLEKVKAAIFNFAKTEDDEFMLHPEHLVTAMPLSEATTLQNRLRAIHDFHDNITCSGRA